MAKAKKAKKEVVEEVIAKDPIVKVDRTKYETTRSASGAKSLSNGDSVAQALEGLELDEVYGIAEGFLVFPLKVRGEPVSDVSELKEAYADLNDGMQRMNIGNRMRKQVHALDKAMDKAEADSEKEGGKPVPKSMKGGDETLERIVTPFHKERDKRLATEEKAKAAKAKEAVLAA